MLEFISIFDLVMIGAILVIAIISLISRKRNSELPPLQREFKNLRNVFAIAAVMSFFTIIQIPHLFVSPYSIENKIESIEDAQYEIRDIRRDMVQLSDELYRFKRTATLFFVLLFTALLPAVYRTGRLFMAELSKLDEGIAISNQGKSD